MAYSSRRGGGKIRPPRKGLHSADIDFDTIWSTLENAFREIHTHNAGALSYEELYRNAYKMVLNKKGGDLYNKVTRFEQQWLASTVRPRIVKLLTAPLMLTEPSGRNSALAAELHAAGEGFLKALKAAWEDHKICMGMLADVLMYMDRTYCTDHRQPLIFAKSLGLFRDEILRSPAKHGSSTILHLLTSVILDHIHLDRDGEKIDQFLIKSNIYMLEGLYNSDVEADDERLYLSAFETRFLETSAQFYRAESERLLKESDAGTYCRHATRRIHEEQDRCRLTLSESTTARIQQVVEDELIKNKMKSLIQMDTGVRYMIDNDKVEDLALVFQLEARVDTKKPELTKTLQVIIGEMGTEINNSTTAASQAGPSTEQTDEKEPDGGKTKGLPTSKTVNQQTSSALTWVEEMLSLRDRFDRICSTAFVSDQIISIAVNRSMADTINSFPRASEYISLFIDDNMKKGIKNKSEAEVDQTLEKAITIIRFLSDKDVFETYYKKHLCKRLLLDKSQSMEIEKQMISRMKMELGNSFTLKLEAMFKDMSLSEELTNGYRAHVAKLGDVDPKRVDLNINVLTSMTWPLEAFRSSSSDDKSEGRAQIIYPPAIDRIRRGFERFYAEKYSGRKLTWQSNMGHADIKATFPRSKGGKPRTHDINCSTYAMLILLLFNALPADATLSLEEIEAKTNIPLADLKRNLQSLAVAPKTRFLTKSPMSREINSGDQFSFNESFKSDFVRIKVGVVSAGNKVEGERERKDTEKKNNENRGFAVEAAVVRIMKQRKELPHAQLLTETISQLSAQFKPDVNMIKKRIESLIEREYLERIDDAPVPSYRYLA